MAEVSHLLNHRSQPIPLLPNWWQLPFSLAMGVGAKVFYRCRLCGIYPSQSIKNALIPRVGHQHWFNQTSFLCQGCHDSIVWEQSHFNIEMLGKSPSKNPTASTTSTSLSTVNATASVFYRYPYNVAIPKFKNQHDMFQLPLLVHALRQLKPPKGCNHLNSLIIPVPTTPSRLQKRGFDPVNMLARYLSFHWQIPLFTHVVREERQKQQGLSRSERLQNVADLFTFTQLPTAKRLILFDDVATTGATLQALVQALVQKLADTVGSVDTYQIHVRALAHGH